MSTQLLYTYISLLIITKAGVFSVCPDKHSSTECLLESQCCYISDAFSYCQECATIACNELFSQEQCLSNPEYCKWEYSPISQCVDSPQGTSCTDIYDEYLCTGANKIDCCWDNYFSEGECKACNTFCTQLQQIPDTGCELESNFQCCSNIEDCSSCNRVNINHSCNGLDKFTCETTNNCCFDPNDLQCIECGACGLNPDYILDNCECFIDEKQCCTATDIFGRDCKWEINNNFTNGTCIDTSPIYTASSDCGYVIVNELQRAVPLDACMKLDMNEYIYTLYTCYNGSVYKETYIDNKCMETNRITQLPYENVYDYQCGLGGNCNYTKIYTFDRCDGNYFIPDTDTPLNNYTLICTVMGEDIYLDDDTYYSSQCSYSSYKLFTPYPTMQPTSNPTMEPTSNPTYHPLYLPRRVLLSTSAPTLDPACEVNENDTWVRRYDECLDGNRMRVSTVHCGYVFMDYDFADAFIVPSGYALNECHSHWLREDYSFEFYCEDGKIYQNAYNTNTCDGELSETRKYLDYTLASCADATYCDTVTISLQECSNDTDAWFDMNGNSTGVNTTMVVDVCMPDGRYEYISYMTKCTDHSVVFYEYNSANCDDYSISWRFEATPYSCEIGGIYSADIINCTAPKCPLIYPYTDSYLLCNIFSETNIDKEVKWWNIDFNNFCDWGGSYMGDARRRMQDYYYDEIGRHYPKYDEFDCWDGDHISQLDLSNYTGIIKGILDTTNYDWPSELRYLNLAGLQLEGKWDWSALENTSYYLQSLDISDNNFYGTFDLKYIVGKNLWDINLSNNNMYGYIDWESLSIIEMNYNNLNFYATGIQWDGYADFSMFDINSYIQIALDTSYQCHPYKYICVVNDSYNDNYYYSYDSNSRRLMNNDKLNFVPEDRNTSICYSKQECQKTCQCADGTIAYPTNFRHAPVIGHIECGRSVTNKYNISDIGIPFNLGDWSHYYLISIPSEYNITNVTFNFQTNFDAILEIYEYVGDYTDPTPFDDWYVFATSESDEGGPQRRRLNTEYRDNSVHVELIGGEYYYLRIVDFWSIYYQIYFGNFDHPTPAMRRRRNLLNINPQKDEFYCFEKPYSLGFPMEPTLGFGRRRNLLFTTTNDPAMEPTYIPTNDPTDFPTEPTYEPTPRPTLPDISCDFSGWKYSISMSGCTLNPTSEPTYEPTIPTYSPTKFTVKGNGKIKTKKPKNKEKISDCFKRFESSFEIYVKKTFNLSPVCFSCFKWFIKSVNINVNAIDNNLISLNELYGQNSDIITFYNVKTGEYINNEGEEYDIIQSYVVIHSIRTSHSGYCVDSNYIDNHPLKPGNIYDITLKIESQNGNSIYLSDFVEIYTSQQPQDGYCNVYDIDNLALLQPFSLECYDWVKSSHNEIDTNFTYNTLFEDVPMVNLFQISSRMVLGMVGTGKLALVALVQDNMDQSIGCYELDVAFPDLDEIFNKTNITVDILNNQIDDIINGVEFGKENHIAIAVFSVINGLYETNRNDRHIAMKQVEKLIGNLLMTSLLLESVNQTIFNLTSQQILSELSTFVYVTSNNEIVNDYVVIAVDGDYIPVIFDIFDLYIERDNKYAITDELHAMTSNIQQLIGNLEYTVVEAFDTEFSNITKNVVNNIAESLIEYAMYSSHIAIAQSIVGESYTFISILKKYKKIISSKKFENLNDDQNINETVMCGYSAENIIVPKSFKKQNKGIYDCTFSKSTIDIYKPNSNSKNNRSLLDASDLVSLNLYESYGGNKAPLEFETNQCDPYLITIQSLDTNIFNNTSNGQFEYILDGENQIFPGCNFWNNSQNKWDQFGCFVYNFSVEYRTVSCGCIHLTSFKLSSDDFRVEANILGAWHWRNLSSENLAKYPTVWIVQMIVFILVMCICFCNLEDHNNRSILAFEDIIFEHVKQEKIKNDVTGKEIEYIAKYLPNHHYLGEGLLKLSSGKDAKKSICLMQFWLFWVYLKNDHTVLSIFQRTKGTNLTTVARMGCFFMYLCTVMFATAIFYGVKQNTWFGDITASFLISFIGTTPVFIVKKIFLNSKPKIIKRTINVDEFKDLDEINTYQEGIEMDESDPEDIDLLNDNNDEINDKELNQIQNKSVESKHKSSLKRKSLLKTTKQYHTNLDLIKTNKMNTRQVTLKNALLEVKKTKSNAAQIKLANDVRITLFNTIYPLPHKYKFYAWVFLTIWTIFVVIMSMQYGVQFDLNYVAESNNKNPNVNKFNEDCWENNKLLNIENELSLNRLNDLQESIQSHFNGDYKTLNTESSKWILNVFQSLILSIFFWQPLMVYITTWIKIWMFSWNLRMKIAPGNLISLCKKICQKENESHLEKEIYNATDNNGKKNKEEAYYIIAHQNRPLDVIGYFTNDQLFLKLDKETGKLKQIESDSDFNTDDDMDEIDKQEKLLSTENKKTLTDYHTGEGNNEELEMIKTSKQQYVIAVDTPIGNEENEINNDMYINKQKQDKNIELEQEKVDMKDEKIGNDVVDALNFLNENKPPTDGDFIE